MAISLAEYYITEIINWVDSINYHLEGSEEISERLNEVLLLNTVPKLAANVEQFLSRLQICKQNMMALKESIKKSESKLYKDNIPVENILITADIKSTQERLRNEMRQAEKAYLEISYDCNEFLAETVYQQLTSRNGGRQPLQ